MNALPNKSVLNNPIDVVLNLPMTIASSNRYMNGNLNKSLEKSDYFSRMDWNKTTTEYDLNMHESTSNRTIILCSCLFFVIGFIGICGNLLVIVSVVCSKKMRTSMTNLLITNLAVADLIIMILGIPEIIQFMRNTGWTLNVITCKVNRYILVSALYGSILTLLALSVER